MEPIIGPSAPTDDGPPPVPPEPSPWSIGPSAFGAPPPEFGPPAPPAPPEPTRRGFTVPRWLIAVVAIVLVGVLGYGLGSLTRDDTSSSKRASTATPQTPAQPNPTPTSPTTPGAAALSGIGLVQGDLPSAFSVELIPAGNQVSGTTTLDLCNGTFPSESLRTARLQVVAADAQGNVPLSTEAVIYQNAAATTQAFDELVSVAAKCPSTPVRSPSGGTTVTTTFDPAPDGAWPHVATVDRLAYSFTSTDQAGQSSKSIAVYLKRGRVLLGLYFPDPTGTIPTISGQRTIPGIVTVFANRIAQLPDSVVNG